MTTLAVASSSQVCEVEPENGIIDRKCTWVTDDTGPAQLWGIAARVSTALEQSKEKYDIMRAMVLRVGIKYFPTYSFGSTFSIVILSGSYGVLQAGHLPMTLSFCAVSMRRLPVEPKRW